MSASSTFIRSNNEHEFADEKLIHSYGRARPCPVCGSSIARVRSRPIDRFIALFHPVYRYKCYNANCSWHGRLASVRVINDEIFI